MRKASGARTLSRSSGSARLPERSSRSPNHRSGPKPAAKVGKSAQRPPPVPVRPASVPDRVHTLLIAALVACASLPYLSILFNGFVYDDDGQVLKNPYVRSFRFLKEIFTSGVWSFRGESSNYYRPLMTLGYLVCYKLLGLRPYGFHLVSLLLHGVVVCLVFVLTERLTGDRVWAFVAGAFFALHPVHSESVAWIAAVPDLELTVFYLLTFQLFLAAARPGGGRSKGVLAGMGGAFLLALLSKEQAMTLPALATVYEHFYRPDRLETTTLQKLARYGPLWLVGLAYVPSRTYFLGGFAPQEYRSELTSLQIVLSAIALVGQYGVKLLWPVRLCAFYVFHPSGSLFDPHVGTGLLVLLGFAALFFVCWRSRDPNVRFASFGIVWFLATLAPILNAHWLVSNVFTERYLYLPSVGVAWLVGIGVSKLWSRAGLQRAQKRGLALAGIAVGALFAARIVIRNRDWNNDIALYNQTLELSPDAYPILNNLGSVYWQHGELDKAESTWVHALAMNPNSADVLNNLGVLATGKHQYAQAVEYLQCAIKLKPKHPDAQINLGDAYMKMGQRGLAEPPLRGAVTLAPLNIRARNKLGQLLVETGRPEEAEEQFRASLSIGPTVIAYDYLGMIDIHHHAWKEAERDFRAALSLDSSDSNAHFGLGFLYKAAGRKAEALSQYEAGLKKDPNNSEALAAVQNLRQTIPRSAL